MVKMIEESGWLYREGGGFALRTDGGQIWHLELSRTPVDLVEKRVRVTGSCEAGHMLCVEAIGPA